MTKQRLRALILAAGRGQRLRPLTRWIPKPLLPVLGRPLVEHTLVRLFEAGCESAALNLHHLGEQIEQRLGRSFATMPLLYSREEVLLGTLGALRPLKEFLSAGDPIVVVNGDSLCRWPIREVLAHHRGSGALATLLLSAKADTRVFGGVGVDGNGRICHLPGGEEHGAVEARFVFAGVHVFGRDLLESVPVEAPADWVRDLYIPLLREGAHIEGMVTAEPWNDLGTPSRYLDAVLERVRLHPFAASTGSWVASGAQVADGCRLQGTVVERGGRLEFGGTLRECLVMEGAAVGQRADLTRVIVGPGVRVPEGEVLEECVLTPKATPAGREGAGDEPTGGMPPAKEEISATPLDPR